MSMREELRELDRLEESINRMNTVHADALRDAIRTFNQQPISVSAVDRLRERVLIIADNLARPLVTHDRQLHSVRVGSADRAHRTREQSLRDGRLG